MPGSRGITRSPEVLAGGITHKCLKGQAGFLGNPAVWGHIHTGTELCPERIISHLRLVCVCAFGGGDGSLYRRSGDSHGLVTRGESHVPCSPQPFLLAPVTTQGESARCVSPHTVATTGGLSRGPRSCPLVPGPVPETSCHLPEGCGGAGWALAAAGGRSRGRGSRIAGREARERGRERGAGRQEEQAAPHKATPCRPPGRPAPGALAGDHWRRCGASRG